MVLEKTRMRARCSGFACPSPPEMTSAATAATDATIATITVARRAFEVMIELSRCPRTPGGIQPPGLIAARWCPRRNRAGIAETNRHGHRGIRIQGDRGRAHDVPA